MDAVFVSEKKGELKKILESDPYAEDSFARVGYKLKENVFGEGKIYLYIKASEEFIKKAEERLKGVAERIEGEKAEKVIKIIEEEESNVASGISLFD